MADARSSRIVRVVGVATLANGAALLATILWGLPLPLLLAVTWSVAVATLAAMVGLGSPETRRRIVTGLAAGLVAGVVATAAYDVAKAVLSTLDPSPYNPFEAARVFGRLLLGPEAVDGAVTAAGWAFHIVNGCTFAVAFTMLFARDGAVPRGRGILLGIGWGVFLETFQLALYPGWLNVRFLDEFRQVSFLAHVVYGSVLGLVAPAALRRIGRSRPATGPGPA